MDKLLVCLTGVANRSIKYTWTSIKDNIVEPLKLKYSVDIAIFNNDVENCRVDNEILNNTDLEIVPYNFLFEYKQVDIDKEIKNIKGSEKNFPPYFAGIHRQNGLRIMCIERKVARFLEKNQDIYQYVVIINADYFFINSLSIEILSEINDDMVGTCYHFDCNGYTDGFYIGTSKTIRLLLDRVSHHNELILPYIATLNYEILLKRFFLRNKIKRVKIPIAFIKIRANLIIIINSSRMKKVVEMMLEFLNKNKKKNLIYKFILENMCTGPSHNRINLSEIKL